MRRTPVIAVSAVVLAAALPGTAAAFPGQGSCAGEGAFVSGTAQQSARASARSSPGPRGPRAGWPT